MSDQSGSIDPKAQAKGDDAIAKATRPWFKKKRFIFLGVIALIVIFNSGSEDDATDSPAIATSVSPETPAATAAVESPAAVETQESSPEETIEVSAQKMIEDLESNALNASNTYEGKRVTVTGKVGNIDASGDYFSLNGTNEYSFTNVQIFINDDQVGTVSGYTKGQEVTVTGTVSEVGEILGYLIDAESLS